MFQILKNVSLDAIIHDACGFGFEYNEKGPRYSSFLPCPVTNEYHGHVTGIVFLHVC